MIYIKIIYFTPFGININYISTLFIFDEKTQKERNYLTRAKICIDKQIAFYLFSFNECKLFEFNNKYKTLIAVDKYFP